MSMNNFHNSILTIREIPLLVLEQSSDVCMTQPNQLLSSIWACNMGTGYCSIDGFSSADGQFSTKLAEQRISQEMAPHCENIDSGVAVTGVNSVAGASSVTASEQLQRTEDQGITEKRAIARAAIHTREKEKYRENAYQCQANKWTVGYGHTGPEVTESSTMTPKEAEEQLQKDLKIAHDGIKSALGAEAYAKLDERRLAVLINLAFNSGVRAVTSTRYFKLTKEGKYDEAQCQLDAVFVNGVVSNGLLIRRAEDMILWGNGVLTPDAKNRLLVLLNRSFGTNYENFDVAEKEMKAILNELEYRDPKIEVFTKEDLERKNLLEKTESRTAEEEEELSQLKIKQQDYIKLEKYRNIRRLFELVKNPQVYADNYNKAVDLATNS